MSAPWQVLEGDCRDVLPTIGRVDHLIADPPYSEQVHRSVRSSGRRELPDVADFRCRTRRSVDLGFEHLDPDTRREVALWAGANVDRWIAVFSDAESAHHWREDLVAANCRYKRTLAWIRVGGAPQFSGDCPAAGFEAITLAWGAQKGRTKWNGGGKAGVYSCAIVANRAGQRDSRVHPTQKPLQLMLDLIRDFTQPGDLVVDPWCGSGTTGVACLRLGRRFIGIERKPEHAATARDRLDAESKGSSVTDARRGQEALFR